MFRAIDELPRDENRFEILFIDSISICSSHCVICDEEEGDVKMTSNLTW